MEVIGNYKALQHLWVEDEDDTCASSISNVSDTNKVRRKRKHRVSKAPNGGVPKHVGNDDAKEPSDLYEEIIRDIKLGTSSPLPNEIDPKPSAVIPRERTSQSSDHRSGSSSRHDKIPPKLSHRRASVETPRIRSRRASIGGKTFYPTSHMAKIDSFLRGSELRLNKNGTCSFVFKEKKFEIETTAESSEFMFYCSVGSLDKLKKLWAQQTYFNTSVTLLHMIALWNEEQITKCEHERNNHASRGSEEEEADVGLLRIDSSKEHPVVALILYGHAKNIKNATHFQDKLDEFVDDALKFHDKLKAGPEEAKDKEEEQIRHCKSQSSSNTNTHHTSLTNSLTSAATYAVVDNAIVVASSESEGLNVASITHASQHESSTERATPALIDSDDGSRGQDDHTSSKKSGLFAKMIKSLRSKQKEDIGKLAFVDPNQNSAFVVDTSTANAVKINISRQSGRRESSPTDDRHQARSKRGSAHTDEIQPKSHLKRGSTIDDGHPKKSSSFNIDDRHRGPTKKSASFFHDDLSGGIYHPIKKGASASCRVEDKRSSSFNIDDRHRGPTKKSASFFHDDFSGGIYHPIKKGASASCRVEEKRSSSEHMPRQSHSDRRVDACNHSRRDRGRSSGFTKSQPALAQNRDEMSNSSSKEYRRHQASDQQRERARHISSRPRRKVHHTQVNSVGSKEEDTSRSRSRQASLPPEIGRSSRRSKSRKAVRRRSKSENPW